MQTVNKNQIELYQQLGRVFYAVAAADNKIRREEVKQLNQIIRTEWVPIEDEEDEFGTDVAYQIEIVFDWMRDNDWQHKGILEDFKTFKEENNSIFSRDLKNLILKTANAIAAAFSGKNKSELVILTQLQLILAG